MSNEQRSIEIYCAAPSHDEVSVGAVIARRDEFGGEWWEPTGVAVTQRIRLRPHEDYVPGYNMAVRFKIVCPACGDDLTLGDLVVAGETAVRAREDLRDLGDRLRSGEPAPPNAERFVEQFDRAERERQGKNWRAHSNLTKAADAGVSRLSMSGLRRTLTLP